MSQPAANCPNCGALVQFRWSSAVQTTCEFCRSILVRRDVNLEKVGEVGDLPPEASPIQIGTEGTSIATKRSKWSAAFSTNTNRAAGTSGTSCSTTASAAGSRTRNWNTTVSFLTTPPGAAATGGRDRAGAPVLCGAASGTKSLRSRAPITAAWPASFRLNIGTRKTSLFADLRTADARFGTIDYSEAAPLLFLGEAVEFDDLQLEEPARIRRDGLVGQPTTAVKRPELSELRCAAHVERRRTLAHRWCARSATPFWMPQIRTCRCWRNSRPSSCIKPLIPLGTRGKLEGADYEVIGFQVRTDRRRRPAGQLGRVPAVQSATKASATSPNTTATGIM